MSPPAPPTSRALLPLTIPSSWLYRAMIDARNRHYDQPESRVRLDLPVISIGNITTGGTGKSPVTAWVIRTLLEHGHKPGVLMRGYGGEEKSTIDPNVNGPPPPRAIDSDEYLELLFKFGERFPVAPDPDRVRSAEYLLHHHDLDVFVLDDGFQHRRVARDLDLVLIDATQDTFNQRLLPAGHLREPIENLKRANAAVVTRADHVDEKLSAFVEKHHGRPPLAWCNHHWARLDRFDGGGDSRPELVESLSGRRVMTLLGVGNPDSIERKVEAAGGAIARRFPVRDHQRYDARLVGRIQRAAVSAGVDAILTTTKDWVKLRTLIDGAAWTTPILVPRLEIKFIEGGQEVATRLTDTIGAFGPKQSDTDGN